MCGIVAAVGQRDVPEILLEGLRRLEYRGYDSAGLAVIDGAGKLRVCKRQGKVAALESALDSGPIAGRTGIAHTRWATHGAPSEINAHPHTSGDRIALVHNGIIENHQELRDELEASGVVFSSETDTEVVVHLIAAALARGEDCLRPCSRLCHDYRGPMHWPWSMPRLRTDWSWPGRAAPWYWELEWPRPMRARIPWHCAR